MVGAAVRRGVVVALAATVLTACRAQQSPVVERPTEAEPRGVLAQYVRAAAATDTAHEYCAISYLGAGCENDYRKEAGDETKPYEPPTVLSADRVVGRSFRVLVVCGIDRRGRPYRSDFPVERDEHGGLRAFIPVYWAGTTFSGEHTEKPVNLHTTLRRDPVGC